VLNSTEDAQIKDMSAFETDEHLLPIHTRLRQRRRSRSRATKLIYWRAGARLRMAQKNFDARLRRRFEMEQFNITMRKYLKEVGVTAQQAIERVVREEKLAGKGKLKVKMVLTGEGTGLRHVVEGEIDLTDAHDT
jgi:Family of unknown function (DUF6494)